MGGSRGGFRVGAGAKPTCVCGHCKKCIHRINQRKYDAKVARTKLTDLDKKALEVWERFQDPTYYDDMVFRSKGSAMWGVVNNEAAKVLGDLRSSTKQSYC